MPGKVNCVVSFLELVDSIPMDKNGCKNWPMGISRTGYGVYSINNFTYSVIRLLYDTLKDGFYRDGLVVRHKCDNRACCNIDHLILGTQSQNIMEASARSRLLFGEKNKKSIFSKNQVIEIRDQYPQKSTVMLAKIYKTSPSVINKIISGKSWPHVSGSKAIVRFNRSFGEASGRAKLTEKIVLEIREKYPELSGPKLAKLYGVSCGTIYCIVKRKSWGHI